MDSDTVLEHAMFRLSPRRSRCELFISGNGKTEKIASGFLKPFITHLKIAAEQAARAASSVKLEVERRKNDGTWFKKGTVERFVRFVKTPEILELVNAFDAENLQLEGAKRVYLQGTGDPLSGPLGGNQVTTEATAEITKKELLRAIDVRLVTVKQDIATAFARASDAGFTPDSVLELLHFAEYFGANRLNEACTKFISLCQRHPELVSLQPLPQSLPPSLKNTDYWNVQTSSSLDMSIHEPEVEPKVPGKPHHGCGIKLHMPSSSHPAQENAAELLGTYQQLKPSQQQFLDRTVGKVVDDPTPAALGTEPAQQDGGDSRHLSVQDRINLFESKKKEQSASYKNLSSNIVVNRIIAGKGGHRRFPSDASDKSVLRRWSGASDMSLDLSSSVGSSFNDREGYGSTSGTPTTVDLWLQSDTESKESMATVGVTASSSLSSHSEFKGLSEDKEHTEVDGNKISVAQTKALDDEQGKHQMSASLGGVKFYELSDQDASRTQQKGLSESGDYASGYQPKSKVTSEDYFQYKEHKALQATSQAAAKKGGSKDQEIFRSQIRVIPLRPDGGGAKDQITLYNELRTFRRKGDDVTIKAKVSSDFQIKPSTKSTISLESQSQGTTFPSTTVEGGGGEEAATEQTFGPIPVEKKEDWDLGINLHKQPLAPDYINKAWSSERKKWPVSPVRSAKESTELLDLPSTSSVEQVQMTNLLRGGNRELNEGLQMKATRLEEHFAAFKLRIQKDEAAVFQTNLLADVHKDYVLKGLDKKNTMPPTDQLSEKKLVKETYLREVDFDANLLSDMVDNQEYESNLSPKFSDQSDDFRGKFYNKYMQKRNSKLLEEWESKRTHKEAKMKAMRDSLERSLTEMRAQFVGSAAGQKSNRVDHSAE
ncbi:unnamed protein product [Musa hybrid cultivar]